MTDASGLVKRLQDLAPDEDDMPVTRQAMLEAATAMTAKDKEIEALRERVQDLWQNPVRCDGCGSSWTNADLAVEKANNPKLLSCCPERKPLNIDEWKARAETAERERDEARAALKEGVITVTEAMTDAIEAGARAKIAETLACAHSADALTAYRAGGGLAVEYWNKLAEAAIASGALVPATEVERLQRDCAEAYQVIGVLAGSHGDLFDDPQVIKALDNLSAASNPSDPRPHDDLLPFTLSIGQPDTLAAVAEMRERVKEREALAVRLSHMSHWYTDKSYEAITLREAVDAIRQLDLSPARGDYVVGWRTMDSAPKDGRPIAVICWLPSYIDDHPGQWGPPKTYAYEQDPKREQCWTDSHRTTCIREDRWIERYRWAPLPVELPRAMIHAATRTGGGE